MENKEYELKSIPNNKCKSLFSMLIIMSGFSIFSATIWIGADLANSFNIKNLLIISIIGNILLTIYISFLAYLGGETGLSTHKLSQRAFGKHGQKITSIIIMLGQFGWFGVGIMMFVNPISSLIGMKSKLLYWLLIIISGILMIGSAFFGIKTLKYVSIISVPLVIIFGLIMMIMAILSLNGANWNPIPKNPNSINYSEGIGMVFASFVSGGTCVPDFVRWSKNGKHAVISTIIAFLIFSTLMLIFGACAYWGTNTNDISDALITMNLAIPGILVLGANIWTTNDNSLYTQGLAASSITGIDKKYAIIFLGLFSTLLAPIINNHFISFLDILNLFLPGIGIIIILNEFIYKDDDSQNNFNFIALISWILGLIISFIFNTYIFNFIIPIYVILFTLIIYAINKYIINVINKIKDNK